MVFRWSLAHGEGGGRDKPILAGKICEELHRVELPIAEKSAVIVNAQIALMGLGLKTVSRAARPHPGIELRMWNPAGARLVIVLGRRIRRFWPLRVLSLQTMRRNVLAKRTHIDGLERNSFGLTVGRKQLIEPDLIVKDHRQAAKLELGMTYIFDFVALR